MSVVLHRGVQLSDNVSSGWQHDRTSSCQSAATSKTVTRYGAQVSSAIASTQTFTKAMAKSRQA